MKALYVVAGFLAVATPAAADPIAVCREPVGLAYYHEAGIISSEESGWSEDRIGGGVITLAASKSGPLDVLFSDATGVPKSARQQGAEIVQLFTAPDSAGFALFYGTELLEIYSFRRDTSGALTLSLQQSRRGPYIYKESLLVAVCDYIRFDLVPPR